ncbi:uncharacterized protein [Chironomus tepperi]|uniref:uncharacterized protein n=1 Tax=Chironomus tepperi TaxID=113505 RepID=UPI00391F475D
MARLYVNRKLVRNPKFCRFCANHDIKVLEKGHRSKCPNRKCTCDECKKNEKKVQTSKNHRKKKIDPQTNQHSDSTQSSSMTDESTPDLPESPPNETAMTLKQFIESNLNDFIDDLSGDAIDATNNGNGTKNASSFLGNLPVIFVDDNLNEIGNFGSTAAHSSQFEITIIENQELLRDSMIETLMTEYNADIKTVYQALFDACKNDYAETVRRIVEAKKKSQ